MASIIDVSSVASHIPNNVSHICVAISGGADSLCLTLLLHELSIISKRFDLVACFVDHKLRPESSTEILPIIDILRSYGIRHDVLEWHHSIIKGNVQAKARDARYQLLLDYCYRNNIECLSMAHHMMDQWETFFMRLSHGSGLSGLSCMKGISSNGDCIIVRPLLGYTRVDIETTLLYKYNITGQQFVRDPSNDSCKYERVRWRKRYAVMDEYGLSSYSINTTINRLQRANDCLDWITQNICKQIFYDMLKCMHHNAFLQVHPELQSRLLIMIIRKCGYTKHISYCLLDSICQQMRDDAFVATTLCGLIFRKVHHFIAITQEHR